MATPQRTFSFINAGMRDQVTLSLVPQGKACSHAFVLKVVGFACMEADLRRSASTCMQALSTWA